MFSAWRRHRLQALYPPPLLGFFLNDAAGVRSVPSLPYFLTNRTSDPECNSVVHGGDFLFNKFMERCPNLSICWYIADCKDGLLLMSNKDMNKLVVYNPMTRWSSQFFDAIEEERLFGVNRDRPLAYCPRLICSEEHPNSFRVVVLATDRSYMVRLAVFSKENMEWSVKPWTKVIKCCRDDAPFWLFPHRSGSSVKNSLFWDYIDGRNLLQLNGESMEFSVIPLPTEIAPVADSSDPRIPHDASFGEGEAGELCVVFSHSLLLKVFVLKRGTNRVAYWEKREPVSMEDQLRQLIPGNNTEYGGVQQFWILAVMHGTVYLMTKYRHRRPCWIMSVSLATMKLQKLVMSELARSIHPYFLVWPSNNIDD